MRQTLLPLLGISAALLVAACDHDHDHGPEGHGGGHDDHGGGHGDGHGDGHGGGHGHGGDGAAEVVTLWGETAQLFVEFPALVKGEDSPFAAHLTRIRDHFAFDAGAVTVELSGGGHPVEKFSIDKPSIPGIFRPVVRPVHLGPRDVALRLESPGGSEAFQMGRSNVFASRAEADAAAPEEEEASGEISFLLEQQWKIPFQIEQIEVRPMRPNIPAFARLTLPSEAEATLTAPRDGRVGGSLPAIGAEIAPGSALFTLSTVPQSAEDLASLDLALAQASIRVQGAQREVDRLKPLVEQGVVAQSRLDGAGTALAEAQAELRSAQRRRMSLGQSQQVQGRVEALSVPSPIGGTLAELFVAPGTWVSQGQPVARVVNRGRLWLDVEVPEAYVGRLGEISGAWFRLDQLDQVFEVGRAGLVSIGDEIDPSTRALPVRFLIDNEARALFAGMRAQAHLISDAPRQVPAVGLGALVDDGGIDVVYVQTGGESFERRPVKLGVRDGAMVEVTEGLAAGEWVVTRGAYVVKLASTSTESVGHGHAH